MIIITKEARAWIYNQATTKPFAGVIGITAILIIAFLMIFNLI